MFKHLLVALDGSDIGLRAVRSAASLAHQLQARLSLCHVRMPYGALVLTGCPYPSTLLPDVQDYLKESAARAQAVLDPGLALAAELGVVADSLMPEHFQAWSGILECAAAVGADLLVLGSHGHHGLSALLLGSVTQKVLAHATLPVLVVR